ncbi:DUF4251 domain-containing protein [Muricauda sp. CAU 1633]|uniref:DUF4251 domain-containing protein n=1 Tax=Allomuricauda sp. CAU 1633 TaxID=2816036 RepID=UPI001A8CD6C6|nr:DUF4251 domain-containing protein [Muricauda sp. CAU 1633]MBO0323176.1 DUF4251 domain-containing protein [Muricauda sp. CAU 1633]
MRTLLHLGIWILIVAAMGCGGTKTTASAEEIEALDNLVANRSFEIQARWARPMPSQALNSISNAQLLPNGSNASRIDITGNASYLRLVGDQVEADLPYYGERQMSGGYDPQRTGIQFEGPPENLQIERNSKTMGYTMRFNINNGIESFQVVAQLMPSRASSFSIVSSHRTQIRYEGTLSEFEEE